MITTTEYISGHLLHRYSVTINSHGGEGKTSEVMTST